MTAAVGQARPAPWSLAEINPDVVLGEVRRVLPGVVAWAGEYTGSFWLLHADHLEEFRDGRALLARVRAIAAWRVPPQRPPSRPGPSAARTSGHAVPQRLAPQGARPALVVRPPRRREPEPFFPPPGRFRRTFGRCCALMRRLSANVR